MAADLHPRTTCSSCTKPVNVPFCHALQAPDACLVMTIGQQPRHALVQVPVMLQIHRYFHPRPQNKTTYEEIKVICFLLAEHACNSGSPPALESLARSPAACSITVCTST